MDNYRFHSFFTINPIKFFILNTITFNFYIFYWFYQNWYFYRCNSQEKFRIIDRAATYNFTFYCLIMHVKREAALSKLKENINVGILWGALIATTSLSLFLPFPLSLGFFLSPIPIINLQKIMIKINEIRGYSRITSSKINIYDGIILFAIYFLLIGFICLMIHYGQEI